MNCHVCNNGMIKGNHATEKVYADYFCINHFCSEYRSHKAENKFKKRKYLTVDPVLFEDREDGE